MKKTLAQYRKEADKVCRHMSPAQKDAWAQESFNSHVGGHDRVTGAVTPIVKHEHKTTASRLDWLKIGLLTLIVLLLCHPLHCQKQTRGVQFQGVIVNGQCVKAITQFTIAVTGAPCGGAGGSPGGSNTQLQYNDAGSFNGASTGTYIKASTLFNFQVGTHFQFLDPVDTTKVVQFDVSGIATGTTRVIKVPDAASAAAQNKAAVSHFFFNSFAQSTGAFGVGQPVCADLSDAAASCATDATNGTNIASGTVANARLVGSGSITVSGATCTLGSTCTVTRICADGLGDGLNAITAGTYVVTNCFNDFGATYTITNIRCFTDNNGTSTLNAANDAATGLLTGAVTCTNSFATGTQSATTTITTAHWINFTFVADGTTKRATFEVTVTR